MYLCVCYFISFTSRHIPVPLFRDCISSHRDIWDGASLQDSQRSLTVDCFLWRASSWMCALVLNTFLVILF